MMEKMDAKNLIVKVSFSLPFCLYIEDDNYEVQMPSYTATLSTKREKQEHIDPRVWIEEATTELVRDRYGRLRYTSVEITMPGQAVIEQETKRRIREGKIQAEGPTIEISVDATGLISEYSDAASEESFAIIDYFIKVYRDVTHAFYVRTFPRDEIFRATINWFYGSECLGGVEQGRFGKGITSEPKRLLPETDQKFRQRLKAFSLPSLYAELAMNARDYLDLGNYRMAVIETRTCVEVIIDQLLLEDFVHKGKTVEDAKELLGVSKRTACASLEDVLDEAKINAKLKKGLKQMIGKSLAEDNNLWGKWLKAKHNREKAVHKAEDVSETDAKDAIDTLSQIFDFIIENR